MVLMNNNHALLRIYSRMVSCAYLAFGLVSVFLFPNLLSGVTAVGYAAFYTILFNAYQDKQSMGIVYYAFLCLGLVSMCYIQVLWLVPVLWLLMATKLLAVSLRTLLASLFGLLTPYWFAACLLAYQGSLSMALSHLRALWQFDAIANFAAVPVPVILAAAFIILMGLIGIVHFLHTSFKDKIRTRIIYEFLMIMQMVLVAGFVLQPSAYALLIPLLAVNSAPLLAHFAALSHGRLSNALFVLVLVAHVVLIFTALLIC